MTTKKYKVVLTLVAVFALSTVVARAAVGVPAADPARGVVPEAYYVRSKSPVLKALLKVRHQFPGSFSAEISSTQLEVLRRLGITTEPVLLYEIMPPNKCGDGVCQGFESPETCSTDCGGGGECYPSDQYPWGVVKVNGGSGGEGMTVAVLDTGVDQDHPDLVGNISSCVAFGYETCEDGHGHGTHVAGTVLANGKIVGVAPQAKLMAVKVCSDDGGCWGDDIAAGIRYAADNGANIVSMSIGGDTQDTVITGAIDYAVTKDVLVVAAAGNDRADGTGSIDYPGAYVKSVAVAAFDSNDVMASFSSLGVNDGDWVIEEKEIEFAAPGVNVESTFNNGCYAYKSGTSMATPHVSGIAARNWQGSASATRTYLQELARYYTENVLDYGQAADDIEAGFGLPLAIAPSCVSDEDCGTGELCCAGQCVVPVCSADTDCGDAETCTRDTCVNARTCDASCRNVWPECDLLDGCCGPECTSETDTDCSAENLCLSCFKGVCDGKCNPAKEDTTCPDCQ